MSLNSGRARLQQAWKDLETRWEKALREWDDPVSRDFHEKHIKPIEPQIRTTVAAMENMLELCNRAQHECR